MSFGKLYTFPGNSRSTAIKAVAKANKLDIEVVEHDRTQPWPADYVKVNPLGKVPSFEGADGYNLTEAIAIAVYFTSQNGETTLLGKTKQDYASILRWMSFFNAEVLTAAASYFLPILGRAPFNKKAGEDHLAYTYKLFDVVENHLLINTYLVGERLTLADLFAAGIASRGFEYILDAKWREANPNTTRWFNTVTNQSIYSDVAPKFEFVQEIIKNIPPAQPKKEKAPAAAAAAAPKAAPKPKAKEVDEEEDDAPQQPKAKHPLEALPKATLVLDEWKRQYSNNDTRPVALPWFWENLKTDEYSLWALDYKYNDELTQTFMTSNLIGGFFARLEASRKYIFGAASVYGVSNDSVIKGAFLVRGQDAIPAFDVAPDHESYAFTKLDPTKESDKEFVNSMWAWDKPIEVKGKTYEWADGKVFK